MFRGLEQYDLVKSEEIRDIRSDGYLLRHKKSGARILLLENNDDNKVFNIAFRTPPADSTGVAHILEHSVLCGSKKFPSKDPFVELAKGSLNTFLNAMTYPDKTMYPVASCNLKDFCNLMDVYLDAVFYPNIYKKEEIFRQEGWSYVLEDPEDEIVYNGVVYNEMKGAFSSADDVLEREILNSLYPDTSYGFESGGDPKVIPSLKYEDFLAFHKKYYHPSNCYIYLYGDMDMVERLKWIDEEYLCHFDAREVDSVIEVQKPFDKPIEIEKTYSISSSDKEEDNTYLAYNLAVGDILDVNLCAAMSIIEYVLLGAPGAPLKQALLDSGIAKDVDGGYDAGSRQPIFSVIAKNANPEDKDEFLKIIHEVLEEQAKNGLEERSILASINNLEFKLREADFGHYPKGLMYGIDVFDSWLHDEDRPFDYLKQIEGCEFLKSKVGTGYFEELIRKYLLNNTHASIIVMRPEKGLTAKEEEEVRKHLEVYKASLSEEEIQKMIEDTRKHQLFGETPSTKEELDAIPVLQLSDIKKETITLYNEEVDVNGVKLLYHDIDTTGIAYLDLLFDAGSLTSEELPYFGILKSVLGLVDTENYNYRELSNEININSGGISPASEVCTDLKNDGEFTHLFKMKAKVLYSKIDFAFDMISEILFTSKLDDTKRLREIIARLKSRLQGHLVSAGHGAAITRSMAHFSNSSAIGERIGGIEFYRLIERIEADFDANKEELIDQLRGVLGKLLKKENFFVSLTCERQALEDVCGQIALFYDKLDEELEPQKEGQESYLITDKNEGFTTSAQVQYVGLAGNYKRAGLSYNGALRILRTIMGYEYLWVNIRVQGGAYGCMSGFGKTGDSYLVSYRDPHLKRTLDVYKGIPEYLDTFEVDERDMRKYIIGTISEMDTPMSPAALGQLSFQAWMMNLTEEDMQRERMEVLEANQDSIRALAPYIRAILSDSNICVIGGEDKINAEKDCLDIVKPMIQA